MVTINTRNTDQISDTSLPLARRQEVMQAMYAKISNSTNVENLDSLSVSIPGLSDVKFSSLDESSKKEIRAFYSIVSRPSVQSTSQQPTDTTSTTSYIPPTLAQAIPPLNKSMMDQFVESASRIWDWSKQMAVEGFEHLKNPKTWETLQGTLVTFASSLVSNIASAMKTAWDEISSTVTDSQKREDFFKKLLNGQLVGDIANTGLNLLSSGFKLLKDTLIKFCEISGLSDLGQAVGALFSGDIQGARQKLSKAGSKFSKLIGLTDLIEGVSLVSEALAKNDPTLYKKALGHLVEGAFRIGTTIFVVGKITAVFQAGRAMLTSFMYRDVSAEALQVAYKSIGKTAATEIERQVTSTQLRQLGLNAGHQLGTVTESIFSEQIKTAVKRDVFAKGAAKLATHESVEVTTHLMQSHVRNTMVSGVHAAAENIGYKTTEKAIELAAKRFTTSGFESLKRLSTNNKNIISRFAAHCKQLGLKEIKNLSDEQVINLVRGELSSLTLDKVERVAKAVKHIGRNNWHYSKAAKKVAMEHFANGMSQDLMENSLGQGFKEGWKASLDNLEAKLTNANVNVDDIRPLLDDVAQAGEEGFEAGVKRASLKFAERLFDKKKKKLDTNDKNKKKENKSKISDKSEDPLTYKDNNLDNAFEDTLDALQYGKIEDSRISWTNERELAEIEKRKLRKPVARQSSEAKDTDKQAA